ncbi:MAG: hypothetical protein M1549_03060 [Candidatus Dependentiae bacterium]|nr:hypothetical protein [Candidatus Dependentiae bacterium]
MLYRSEAGARELRTTAFRRRGTICLLALFCSLQPIQLGATWSPSAFMGRLCGGLRQRLAEHPVLSVALGLAGVALVSAVFLTKVWGKDQQSGQNGSSTEKKSVKENESKMIEAKEAQEQNEEEKEQGADNKINPSLAQFVQLFDNLKAEKTRKQLNSDEKKQVEEHLQTFEKLYAGGQTPSQAFYALKAALQIAEIAVPNGVAGIADLEKEGDSNFDKDAHYAFLLDEPDLVRSEIEDFFIKYMYSTYGAPSEQYEKMQGAESPLRYHYKIHLMPGGAEKPKDALEVAGEKIAYTLDGAEAARLIAGVMKLYMFDEKFAACIHSIKVVRRPLLAMPKSEKEEHIAPFMVIYPREEAGCAQQAINLLAQNLNFSCKKDSYKTPRFNTLFTPQKPGLFYAMGDGQLKGDPGYAKDWLAADMVHFKYWENLELKPQS